MKMYNENYLDSSNSIFPDKLNNMNNYSLRIPVYNATPYLSVWTESDEEIIVNGKGCCVYFEILARKINFNLHFILEKEIGMDAINSAIEKLENNTFTMLPLEGLVISMLYGRNITLGNFVNSSKLVFIVPNTSNIRLDFSLAKLIYIACFSLITLILIITVHFLKPASTFLKGFQIFRILLCISTWQPRGFSERIIFFTIAVLSTIYSSDFFSTLIDMKFIRYEQRFDSFEDLINSKLSIYSNLEVNEYDTEEVKQLFSISKKLTSFMDCIEKLVATNDVACMSGHWLALDLIESYTHMHGTSPLRISGLSFRYDFNAYSFEKASPFVEKFNLLHQRILEGGLLIKRNSEDIPIISLKLQDITPGENNPSAQFLLVIMFTGFCFSIVAFIYEVSVYHYNLRRY